MGLLDYHSLVDSKRFQDGVTLVTCTFPSDLRLQQQITVNERLSARQSRLGFGLPQKLKKLEK